MFPIIFAALSNIVMFLLRGTVIKFMLFGALFYFVIDFVPNILSFMEIDIDLGSSINDLPSGVLYFMNIVDFSTFIKIVLSAYISRFVIRRLPIVG